MDYKMNTMRVQERKFGDTRPTLELWPHITQFYGKLLILRENPVYCTTLFVSYLIKTDWLDLSMFPFEL